jgi:hypothetical protein
MLLPSTSTPTSTSTHFPSGVFFLIGFFLKAIKRAERLLSTIVELEADEEEDGADPSNPGETQKLDSNFFGVSDTDEQKKAREEEEAQKKVGVESASVRINVLSISFLYKKFLVSEA